MRKQFLYFYSLILILSLSSCVLNVNAEQTYEDFTTYTEVDPNNHIDVFNSTHIDWDCYGNEDARLYKDYGVGYFGDFEHWIDFQVTTQNGVHSYYWAWGVTNALDDYMGLRASSETYLAIFGNAVYYFEWIERLYLAESYEGVNYYTYTVISLNTWYYLRLNKTGTSLFCRIWTESESRNNNSIENYLGELSHTLHANHSFRYVLPCNTWNEGVEPHSDGDIENYILHPVTVEPYNWFPVTLIIGLLAFFMFVYALSKK